MCKSLIEQRVLARVFMYASGNLEQFRLDDIEVLDLMQCPEYNNFSPEFQMWLEKQFDCICTAQGQ